jgi:hypothetical protein
MPHARAGIFQALHDARRQPLPLAGDSRLADSRT